MAVVKAAQLACYSAGAESLMTYIKILNNIKKKYFCKTF
jgi:uncharacterized protein YqgV (UPF0045/DUF77 family)